MYHYTECGLNNILIDAEFPTTDDAGEKVMTIPAINMLHHAIADGVINAPGLMTGAEIRFLRTEMGMTQAQLASVLHRESQSVARWEKGEVEIDPAQDMLIRKLAAEHLEVDIRKTMTELSRERADTRADSITIKHAKKGKQHRYEVAA